MVDINEELLASLGPNDFLPRPINETVLEYQYVVKVVCGDMATKEGMPVVSRGAYTTAINVYNHSTCKTAIIRRRLSVGLPHAKSGPISKVSKSNLGPCLAMEVDCADIMEMAPNDSKFVKGFVVLESNLPLEVVAVYTAAGLTGGKEVTTMHTERVPEREFNPCGNLYENLATDTGTKWRVIRTPSINRPINFPARAVATPSTAWGSIPGSAWIESPFPYTGRNATFIFDLQFQLCCGFDLAWMDMSIMADNSARVILNGNFVQAHTGFAGTPGSVQTANQNLFKAGENHLTIKLNNISGPTGLIVGGHISALRGDCDNPLKSGFFLSPPNPTFDPVTPEPHN